MEKATSREKGQPLCMAQYYRLMKSYREPGLVKDRLIDVESDLTLSRPHIIIACKSQVCNSPSSVFRGGFWMFKPS